MDYRELALQDQLRKLEHQKWSTDNIAELSEINKEIKNVENRLSLVRLENLKRNRMHTGGVIGR